MEQNKRNTVIYADWSFVNLSLSATETRHTTSWTRHFWLIFWRIATVRWCYIFNCMGGDCGERVVLVVYFLYFPLSYGVNKGAHNSDNHVFLSHFLKVRLCFEHARYLNAWRKIIGNMVNFLLSIIFVVNYSSAPPTPYTRSLTRFQEPTFEAGKLQFEGATYWNAWDWICLISHVSFGKLVSFSDIFQHQKRRTQRHKRHNASTFLFMIY